MRPGHRPDAGSALQECPVEKFENNCRKVAPNMKNDGFKNLHFLGNQDETERHPGSSFVKFQFEDSQNLFVANSVYLDI